MIVSPSAEQDIEEAVSYYREQSRGLAHTFLEHLTNVLIQLENNPESFQKIHLEIRKAPIRKFSYGIYYVNEKDQSRVIAIVHDRRNSISWKRRK